MKKYSITKYDKFHITTKDKDVYTFHKGDNNCQDIKEGDVIEMGGRKYLIKELIEFEKSFGMKGDNISVVVEEYVCDCQIGMAVLAHNSNCPWMKNLLGYE